MADRAIDFTIMYATHRAFRRDLGRLSSAAADGRATAPEVLAGWRNFSRQLDNHHSVEDAALWPQVEARTADRPADRRLMRDMAAEHARLDPRVEAVENALAEGAPDLAGRIDDLYDVMDQHFTHEENGALPLIQEVLTAAEWRRFGLANARNLGVGGVATFVPWVIDGAAPEERSAFLASFPPPVRAAHGMLWARSYRRKHLWTP